MDDLSYEVLGAAIEVHKIMGSGLLESVYQKCMKEELLQRKINFCTEFQMPIEYKGKILEIDFKCDIFVENSLVVELKAVRELHPIFEAQLLTYMKLLKAPKGLLINFNCVNIFREGQKSYVSEYFRSLPSR